jgi:hypothetical protein
VVHPGPVANSRHLSSSLAVFIVAGSHIHRKGVEVDLCNFYARRVVEMSLIVVNCRLGQRQVYYVVVTRVFS